MPKTIIEQKPKEQRKARLDGSGILKIAELFGDTIQGENVVGIPSTFLRLRHCTLNCSWCDTLDVWRVGNPYSIEEVLDLLEENNMIERYRIGQHIIFTGGSPLLQQDALIEFCKRFDQRFGFTPHYEIENECTLMPKPELIKYIKTWNNSPKLDNSGNMKEQRYKPDVLKVLSELPNSWFKFVVQSENEWEEIEEDFLTPGLIKKDQIVLMPEGQSREELQSHYQATVNLAVEKGVRMTDRLHVTIWNLVTAV